MKADQKFYSGLRKEWKYVIFRGRKKDWERGFLQDKVILCGMLGQKISLILYLGMKEKRERGGGLSKLNACHIPCPLHDAGCQHGSHVICRLAGSHLYVVISRERQVKHSYTVEMCTWRVIRSYNPYTFRAKPDRWRQLNKHCVLQCVTSGGGFKQRRTKEKTFIVSSFLFKVAFTGLYITKTAAQVQHAL